MCEEMSTKVSCTSVASDRFPLSNLLKSSTEVCYEIFSLLFVTALMFLKFYVLY